MDNIQINVEFPTDENGYTGRECPSCHQYFKVKFGTGKNTQTCHCPYCNYKDEYSNFITKAQKKYALSIAKKEAYDKIINPFIDKFQKDLKKLERKTRGGMFQIKVKTSNRKKYIPIKNYQEKELETQIECNNCTLQFAIYGVFSNCPDCKEISAISIFHKSLDTVKKRIQIANELDDKELKNSLYEDSLSNCISAFDGLGKALQLKYENKLSQKRNLFQKIFVLSNHLEKDMGFSLADLVGQENYDFMLELFQARHLFEHNYGEIDEDFIKKIPDYDNRLNRKYPLDEEKLIKLSKLVREIGEKIIERIDE